VRGIFVISIDVEFAWGLVNLPITAADYERISAERQAVERILTLFENYNIRATWAVVGHLFRERIEIENGRAVPEIPRPVMRGEEFDWFTHLAEGPREAWCAPDVVERIRSAKPKQEIGSHSFAHIVYDEERANGAAIAADVRLAKETHAAHGVPFETFVFPCNCSGFKEVLREAGIRIYRGHTRRWYDGVRPRALWRLMNLVTHALGVTPPVVTAERDEYGVINVPDSMLLYHRQGVRRLITPWAQERMARRGLESAARQGKIFHMWFHPSNIAYRIEEQCAVMEKVLRHAQEMIQRGELENATMGELARRTNKNEE